METIYLDSVISNEVNKNALLAVEVNKDSLQDQIIQNDRAQVALREIKDEDLLENFKMTIDTRYDGATSSTSYMFPIRNGIGSTIYWGDGTSTVITDVVSTTHEYAVEGIYKIKVRGSFSNIWVDGGASPNDSVKIISVDNWGSNEFTTFEGAFYSCVNLASIATDVINGGLISDNGFDFSFTNTGIETIPAGIFDNCPNVSSNGFKVAFSSCILLKEIPAGLFDKCLLVSATGFAGVFNSCILLKEIPAGLFDKNTLVSGMFAFYGAFYNCLEIKDVPEGLFRNNILVEGMFSFRDTFANLFNLSLNKYIFYNEGEQATRFLNLSPDFTDCFKRDTFNGEQGEAPDLWNCDFGTGSPTTTGCFGGDGNNSDSLSNYDEIPEAWK